MNYTKRFIGGSFVNLTRAFKDDHQLTFDPISESAFYGPLINSYESMCLL